MASAEVSVRAVSARPGLLFTDTEPVDVRVEVKADHPAQVRYTLKETDGPWHGDGAVAVNVQGGRGEAPLPLKLPGRGLYELNLTATAGGESATSTTWIAIVFPPDPPTQESPWGIFYAPHIWYAPREAPGARDAAQSHRLLGASWSRLNFWAHSYENVKVSNGTVSAEWKLWRDYARELRKQGIWIMGEIAQCPRELSSQPDATQAFGDAGEKWARVRPADYVLWDQLMTNLAAEFREEIGVWEIWNEVNLPNNYWSGTPEELAELVHHTSSALRKGNPQARIAGCGFVGGHDYADRLFAMGMGRDLDILSVHYTDRKPGDIAQWRELLRKHNLNLPIWNSEEQSEIPLENIAAGIERSFKFIHVAIGYPEFRPLVRKDLTVLPAGIAFSVGAHCIGSARSAGTSDQVPGYRIFYFQRGNEQIAAIRGMTVASILPDAGRGSITFAVEPMEKGRAPTVTDLMGRSRPLQIEKGRARVTLDAHTLLINGAAKLEVLASDIARESRYLFEAESGRHSSQWGVAAKEGFSGGKVLELWTDRDEPHHAEIDLNVPAEGDYEVIFSGNSLGRLASPPSLSTFDWSIDGGPARAVRSAVPELVDLPKMGEGLSSLGVAHLTAGRHSLRLTLTARRQVPDQHYALWFDAIILRPVPAPRIN